MNYALLTDVLKKAGEKAGLPFDACSFSSADLHGCLIFDASWQNHKSGKPKIKMGIGVYINSDGTISGLSIFLQHDRGMTRTEKDRVKQLEDAVMDAFQASKPVKIDPCMAKAAADNVLAIISEESKFRHMFHSIGVHYGRAGLASLNDMSFSALKNNAAGLTGIRMDDNDPRAPFRKKFTALLDEIDEIYGEKRTRTSTFSVNDRTAMAHVIWEKDGSETLRVEIALSAIEAPDGSGIRLEFSHDMCGPIKAYENTKEGRWFQTLICEKLPPQDLYDIDLDDRENAISAVAACAKAITMMEDRLKLLVGKGSMLVSTPNDSDFNDAEDIAASLLKLSRIGQSLKQMQKRSEGC